MGRRNDLDICADILGVAQYGARKTHIVYQTNLNFNILKKYLDRLLGDDLIEKTESRHYVTTEKGVEFLKRYRELMAPNFRY